jgi:hypothetical protein
MGCTESTALDIIESEQICLGNGNKTEAIVVQDQVDIDKANDRFYLGCGDDSKSIDVIEPELLLVACSEKNSPGITKLEDSDDRISFGCIHTTSVDIIEVDQQEFNTNQDKVNAVACTRTKPKSSDSTEKDAAKCGFNDPNMLDSLVYTTNSSSIEDRIKRYQHSLDANKEGQHKSSPGCSIHGYSTKKHNVFTSNKRTTRERMRKYKDSLAADKNAHPTVSVPRKDYGSEEGRARDEGGKGRKLSRVEAAKLSMGPQFEIAVAGAALQQAARMAGSGRSSARSLCIGSRNAARAMPQRLAVKVLVTHEQLTGPLPSLTKEAQRAKVQAQVQTLTFFLAAAEAWSNDTAATGTSTGTGTASTGLSSCSQSSKLVSRSWSRQDRFVDTMEAHRPCVLKYGHDAAASRAPARRRLLMPATLTKATTSAKRGAGFVNVNVQCMAQTCDSGLLRTVFGYEGQARGTGFLRVPITTPASTPFSASGPHAPSSGAKSKRTKEVLSKMQGGGTVLRQVHTCEGMGVKVELAVRVSVTTGGGTDTNANIDIATEEPLFVELQGATMVVTECSSSSSSSSDSDSSIMQHMVGNETVASANTSKNMSNSKMICGPNGEGEGGCGIHEKANATCQRLSDGASSKNTVCIALQNRPILKAP